MKSDIRNPWRWPAPLGGHTCSADPFSSLLLLPPAKGPVSDSVVLAHTYAWCDVRHPNQLLMPLSCPLCDPEVRTKFKFDTVPRASSGLEVFESCVIFRRPTKETGNFD